MMLLRDHRTTEWNDAQLAQWTRNAILEKARMPPVDATHDHNVSEELEME
jgi:hypothetical protein